MALELAQEAPGSAATTRSVSSLRWTARKAARRCVHAVCGRLYRDDDGDLRNSSVLAGTARSGTTWLADVIASRLRARVLFEPFHPGMVEAFRRFHYFQYMRPEDDCPELLAYCRAVLSGAVRDPWIDRYVDRLRPRARIVKDIRANLFLRWLAARFPEVPVIFVLRHPCAVVLSRLELDWATDADIASFLAQEALVEDFLADKLDVIRRATTPEEKHAVIWCVSNLVPLQQFRGARWTPVFYEHLCARPDEEVERVFAALGRAAPPRVRLRRPSSTSRASSAVVIGDDRLDRWQRRLSSEQVARIRAVIDAFGLGWLYGASLFPLSDVSGGVQRS